MDPIGWFIATLHQLLGHDKAAAYLGQPPGNRDDCILCAYEHHHDDDHRAAVVAAIGTRGEKP